MTSVDIWIQLTKEQIMELVQSCTIPTVVFKEGDPSPEIEYAWKPASAEIVYLAAITNLKFLYKLKQEELDNDRNEKLLENTYRYSNPEEIVRRMVALKGIFCSETLVHSEGEPPKTVETWTNIHAKEIYEKCEKLLEKTRKEQEGKHHGNRLE